MSKPPPLSRDAQAVIDAVATQVLADRRVKLESITAAVARALADQCSGRAHHTAGMGNGIDWDRRLMAIAAELEAQS